MWTIDDVWKVWDFLKGGSTYSSSIDSNLSSIAKSEKDRTTTFFENIFDQYCFLSPDYNRLKNMWIDWYSTFKSFSVSQKETSDPFSLTEANLVELMKSFGYTYYVEALSFNSKVNFFLDLVNLYKVKGTPFALDRVLAYFGLSDMELVEYDLEKTGEHDLIFEPYKSIPNYIPPVNVEVPGILFNDMIFDDPHWMMTKQQILDGFAASTTNLPSRSPYFGINAYFDMGILSKCISILSRKVQDDYKHWLATGLTHEEVELKKILGGQYRAESLAEEIKLKKISGFISILELYLATCYLFNDTYGSAHGTGPWFLSYNLNTPDPTNYSAISTLWDTLHARPSSRFDRDLKLYQFQNSFHRSMGSNFIHTAIEVGDILKLINPILKIEVDSWITSNSGEILLAYFLNELTSWIQNNIDPEMPNLMIVMLGIGPFSDIYKVINFFKPYRARLHRLTFVEYFKDKLSDSIIVSDRLYENIIETFIDWDTADSWPGYLENWPGPDDVPVKSNPPLGNHRIHNLYVTPAGVTKAVYSDATSVYISTIVSQPPVGCHRVLNVYLGDAPGGDTKQLYVEYNDTAETAITPGTIVVSNPTAAYYVIRYMYISSGLYAVITYEYPARVFPVDSTARVYYTRNTYDAGSFFDIGVSTDWSVDNPDGMHTEIYQYIYDVYNAHPPDTTSYPSWEIVYDAPSSEVEIILNGGFETAGAGGADVLANWAEYPNGTSTIVRDAVSPITGAASAKLTTDATGSHCFIEQFFTLIPGARYNLSFKYKTSSGSAITRRIDVRTTGTEHSLNEDGTWSNGYVPIKLPQGNGIVQYFSLNFIALPDHASYIIYPYAGGADDIGEDVWFDEVSVREQGIIHTTITPGGFIDTHAANVGWGFLTTENYGDIFLEDDIAVLNGGFETAGTGGADVFASWAETIEGGTSTITRDTVAPITDTASCKFTIDAGGDNCYLGQGFKLLRNELYRLSFKHKTSAGTASVRRFDLRTAGTGMFIKEDGTWNSGAYFTLQPQGNGVTQTFSVDFRSLSDVEDYLFYPYAGGADDASKSVWFDDITIQKINESNIFLSDSTAITRIYSYGGFMDFDEGWLFDSPFNNDVCMIEVQDS